MFIWDFYVLQHERLITSESFSYPAVRGFSQLPDEGEGMHTQKTETVAFDVYKSYTSQGNKNSEGKPVHDT